LADHPESPTGDGDLPAATVVKDGKVPGDVPRPPVPERGRRPKRRWSNYLLDKRLQLRYVLMVTILSALISGSLGYLIYQQEHRASQDLAAGLDRLSQTDDDYADIKKEATSAMASRDQALVLKMVGAGAGLVMILSLYLLIMTHKVAGPLYKMSTYFDDMAQGRVGPISGPRRGDMLQDFFGKFREMHDDVRKRLTGDVDAMQRLLTACAAAGVERSGDLGDELDSLETHVAARKQALS